MDATAIIVAGIPALSAVIVSALQICASRRQKADAAARKVRQEETDAWGQRQENLLLMILRGGRVTGELAYAVGMAYKRGAPNGELDGAIRSWNEYNEEFEEYKERLEAENFKK